MCKVVHMSPLKLYGAIKLRKSVGVENGNVNISSQ